MNDSLISRIADLDDKQACFIATRLSRDLLSGWNGRPSVEALASWADPNMAQAGGSVSLVADKDWLTRSLKGEQAGEAARAILLACGASDELAPALEAALTRYGRDERADLGVFSLPIALGLSYLLIAGEVDLDLGFVRVRKKGLTGDQQVKAIKDIFPALTKLIGKLYS
jgi:hypothetical protein